MTSSSDSTPPRPVPADEVPQLFQSAPESELISTKNENGNAPEVNEQGFDLGPGRPVPPAPMSQKQYEVEFLEKDIDFPENWTKTEKALIIANCAFCAMVVVFGSAVFSAGLAQSSEYFHVSEVVSALNISLYVVGFAVGPVIWGPLSELIGRRIPMCIGLFGFVLFSFAGATAKDLQTLILSRFFMGTIGAVSITVGPAIGADTFNAFERGRAISLISLMITAGPMLAPVIGGYITNSYLGWRWTQYITGIWAALVLVIAILLLKETYHPKILKERAELIRNITGNWAVYAPIEKKRLDFREIFERTILKPLIMLAVEPILLLVSVYHGLVYGILYLCLEAVPLIFQELYQWKGGNVYLPYLAMLVGSIAVCATNFFVFEPIYVRKLKELSVPVLPEQRMPLMILSGFFFPIGIFLLCWSGAYTVFWFVPCIGIFCIGFGIVGIFMAAFNYIIDSYLMLAASGIAANTFVRSGMGAAFPLFAAIMFRNLGTQWAGTLLGCLAAVLVPVPILFYKFGKKIRSWSKYAIDLDDTQSQPVSRRTSRSSHQSRRNSVFAV